MIDQELPFWIVIPAAVLLVAAGLLALTGSLGLIRLKTFYQRIHAPTLGNTLGVVCVLIASSMVFTYLESRPILHEVLIVLLLFLTSPVTAMLLMRAAVFRTRELDETKTTVRETQVNPPDA